MFNLFDILESQTGNGMQALGQQFGLSPEQSRRAMEALLPALTIGLQRNVASDPTGFARLFGLVGADPMAGGFPRPPSQPDLLLGQLFGSPMISQAVLQQAAALSGVATPALRQMLPMMAGMIVAGIVHVMINQPPPAPPPPAPVRRTPDPEVAGAFPAAKFWTDWIDGFIAATKPDTPASASPAPAFKDVTPERQPTPPRPEPTTAKDKAEDGAVPMEAFQKLFETGIEVQEQNVRAMQDIFDSFWSNPVKDQPAKAHSGPDAPVAAGGETMSPDGLPQAKPRAARGAAARARVSKPGPKAKPGAKGKPG